MRFDWDRAKSDRNRERRGKGLDEAPALFLNAHHLAISFRKGQRRWEVWGYLDGKEWLGVFEFDYNGALRGSARIRSKNHQMWFKPSPSKSLDDSTWQKTRGTRRWCRNISEKIGS
jgi:uncharacterized DUF497 family protein